MKPNLLDETNEKIHEYIDKAYTYLHENKINKYKGIDIILIANRIMKKEVDRKHSVCTYISNDDKTYTPLCDGDIIVSSFLLNGLMEDDRVCPNCGLEITGAS